jgi:tetratricopeptide (TPR) repeat protein
VAVFLPVRHLGFVWDDYHYLHYNPLFAAGPSLAGAGRAFVSFHSANWHPVTWLSHMADLALFGLEPAGHHLVSLILHAVNASLLFTLLSSLTGRVWRSMAVAALFAVHPLRVESVAWVAERKDLLAALFSLGALLAYERHVRAPGRRRFAAAFALLALALAAKPMAVTVPVLMLVLDWWPLGRAGTRARWKALVGEKLPFAALAAASAVVTLAAQSSAGALDHFPFAGRLANSARSLAVYLRHAFWPADLSPFYPLREVSLPAAAGSVALLALLTALALRAARRQPWLLAGWTWYLVALLPAIGLVQVGAQAMADRYTYLPLTGIFAAVVWSVAETVRLRAVSPAVPAALTAGALVALAFITRSTIPAWRDEVALWSRAQRLYPGTQRISLNLGIALRDRGDLPGAEQALRAALRAAPEDNLALTALGVLLVDTGREAEGVPLLERALRDPKPSADAAVHLGRASGKRGDTVAAISFYRRAVGIDRGHPRALNDLGVLLAGQGEYAEAASLFRRALRARPGDPVALRNLARTLELGGDLPGALQQYEAALKAEPGNPETRAMRDRVKDLLENGGPAARGPGARGSGVRLSD